MPLGRVLIPVDGTRLLEAKLDWALALAPRFAPTIDVIFLYGTVDPMTVDRSPLVGDDAFLAVENTWLDRAAGFRAVRLAVQEWAERRQVPFMSPRKDGAAFIRLVEVTTSYSAAVEEQGRVSDLIVVGQPGDGMTALEVEINRLSLMTTGRRMVVIPEESAQSDDILGNVLLAWEGGLQSTRMISSMMDLLVASSKVTIYTAGEASDVARKHERMRDYLLCNGIDATFIADEISSRIGRKVLEIAAENAVGLICLGAYEHPRMVELVIGGNTRHLYGRSKFPLILNY
jgi:nucleotide-binding universal stress UspA family protein